MAVKMYYGFQYDSINAIYAMYITRYTVVYIFKTELYSILIVFQKIVKKIFIIFVCWLMQLLSIVIFLGCLKKTF